MELSKSLQCLLALSMAFCAVVEGKEVDLPEIKALLVTGGCCHDYSTQQEIIPSAIDLNSKLKVQWTIVYQRTEATDSIIELYKNPDWAKGYDVVVHNECFARIGDVEYIDSILRPHLDGVPAVLIHCTMHSYRNGPTAEKWWEFCGVHSPKHGKKHPFEVQIVASEHETMQGMENWTTPQGELYFIKKTYPTMTPLAESPSKEDGSLHTNIWVNAYGPQKTRIFATTIGHHNETMLQAEYMEMITRGFLWAAGKPVLDNLTTIQSK